MRQRKQSQASNKTLLAGHLKHWRSMSQMSQLELALQCGTSARHLSFIETGRAVPCRELLTQICDVLNVPVRAKYNMFISSGHTPPYENTGLSESEMADVKHLLYRMIKANEPYPAIVTDRCFNITMYNNAFFTMCEDFVTDKALLDPKNFNILRVSFHPDGLSRYMINLSHIYKVIMRRAYNHLVVENVEDSLRELLDEMSTYRPADHANIEKYSIPNLAIPIHLKNENYDIQFNFTVASLGTPLNITLQEWHLQMGYPINDESENYFKRIMDSKLNVI